MALPLDAPTSPIYYPDSEVDSLPVALNPIVPRYPSESAAAAVGGKVTLRLLIDEAGDVQEAIVVETEPPEVFDESARIALKNVRFKPAEKDGRRVGCQTIMSIVYAGSGTASAAR